MQTEISQVKEELQAVKMECQAVKDKLSDTKQQMADGIAAMTAVQTSPSPSYVDVIRTPPTSLPSNIRTLSSTYAASSTLTSTLYCTIDTSRVEEDASGQILAGAIRTIVEGEIRAEQDGSLWRCRAVTMDPKNPHRVRIACRDETKL